MKKHIKNTINNTKAKVWFVLNMICTITYLLWRVFFTLPIGFGAVAMIAGISLLVVEALGLVEALVHYLNMYNAVDYEKPEIAPEQFPDVDVFIATYNEPVDLMEKTLLACKRMDYPDKKKVHIYLCDDARRPEMRELANRVGVNYLDREDHKGNKAGNLNNALAHSSSPYIVTFDADMLPRSCFLLETIPYFVDAEMRNAGKKEEDKVRLGFLQTPQAFYDMDLFQFNLHSETKIPNEQDYFYRDIEVARTRTNSCIYGGSNTIITREALNAIGGFFTEAITEDFATGLLIQKAGFVTLSISKKLASGVSAKTLQDLIQQRVRWARGVISTGRKMHIYTAKDLSFGQKMNYWASIWYWYAPIKRFIYIMSPILYATFGIMFFRCNLFQVLLFWLPMYITSNLSLKHLSNNIRNTKWTSIYEYALFPYMIIPIILETFGFSLKKFKVTRKDGQNLAQKDKVVYMVPFLILIFLSIVGIVRCFMIIFGSGSLGPVVVLFWLTYNLYNMIMCLFFVDGREIYRNAERVYIDLPGILHIGDREYRFFTKDMSETGIALYMEKPILISERDEDDIFIEVFDREWHARIKPSIKHTKEEPKRMENNWLYAFTIEGFVEEKDYDQWLAILYDRVPTNPSEIKRNNGIYDDLSTNLEKRLSESNFMKRHFPRIQVRGDVPVIIHGKRTVMNIADFNYQFFSTREDIRAEKVEFIIGDYKIPARYVHSYDFINLYEVTDLDKIYPDQATSDGVMEAMLKLIDNNKRSGGDKPPVSGKRRRRSKAAKLEDKNPGNTTLLPDNHKGKQGGAENGGFSELDLV